MVAVLMVLEAFKAGSKVLELWVRSIGVASYARPGRARRALFS